MRFGSLLLLLSLAASALASSPAEAVAAAAQDLARVPEADRPHCRYLTLYAVPAKDRPEFLKVLSFQVNSLSRKARLRRLEATPDGLVRLDLRDFKWGADVYERLAGADPYFRELVAEAREEKVVADWPGGVWPGNGKSYPPGSFKYEKKIPVPTGKKVVALAPWLPAKDVAYLVEQTRSKAPVLRADFFFAQTAVAEERAAGYYDFLGLKSRADFFDLIGFELKKAQAAEREIAAILQESGVAAKNRQVYRFGALDGGYWQTRDAFERQAKERNAVDNLNGDYRHQAEEHYGFLPNRLFAYFLSDADGNGQKSAPDKVGADRTSTSNDLRIHAMLSCVRCHKEGLRPLDDFGRRLFQGGAILASYDKAKFERLERLYLLPLARWLDRDVRDYADALAELNGPGWTPAKNAEAYRAAWERWHDRKVTLADAAAELGVPGLDADRLRAAVRRYASPPPAGLGQLVPNSVLAFAHDRPLAMLREHFEEHHGLLQKIARGFVEVPKP